MAQKCSITNPALTASSPLKLGGASPPRPAMKAAAGIGFDTKVEVSSNTSSLPGKVPIQPAAAVRRLGRRLRRLFPGCGGKQVPPLPGDA